MKKATIHWLKPEEGGRKTLPASTTTYYATTVLDETPKHWSIVIQFEKPLAADEYMAPCKISFLVDTAPFHVLEEAGELDVYEGPKKVAKVVIDNN